MQKRTTANQKEPAKNEEKCGEKNTKTKQSSLKLKCLPLNVRNDKFPENPFTSKPHFDKRLRGTKQTGKSK